MDIEILEHTLLLLDELDSVDYELEHSGDERHQRLSEDEAQQLGTVAI